MHHIHIPNPNWTPQPGGTSQPMRRNLKSQSIHQLNSELNASTGRDLPDETTKLNEKARIKILSWLKQKYGEYNFTY